MKNLYWADEVYKPEHCEDDGERKRLREAKRRVKYRQIGGDDGYQYCLIIDNRTRFNGMMRSEVVPQAQSCIRNFVEGRDWFEGRLTIPSKENSRERWVRRTRWSVARALAADEQPTRAQDLVDNLDITTYLSGIGFVDLRSEREISAALRWMVKEHLAEEMTFSRDDYDYAPGKHYAITAPGIVFARKTFKESHLVF